MNRIFTSITFILLIGITTGCKDEEPEGENKNVWAYHRLVYDADTDKTYARTTFRYDNMDGQAFELVPMASITFNGEPLNWSSADSFHETQLDGLVESGTFTYTASDGNTYSNTIEVPSPIGFPPELDSLFVDETYVLNWTGDVLEEDERVQLTLSAENTSGVEQEFTAQDEGEASVELTEDHLDNLGTGTTDMHMQKVFVPVDFDAPPGGGILESRYEAESNLDITVSQ